MGPNKKKRKKQSFVFPKYNDICYLAENNPVPDRCGEKRLHLYVEAWLGYDDLGEEYYRFVYKRSKKKITSLGSGDSFEHIIQKIHKEISKDENKDKTIGDVILLTHGIEHFDKESGETITVKIKLPLLSLHNFDGSSRTIPMWWQEISSVFDTEEIKKLRDTNSDYYKYVDGENNKDQLVSKILKEISEKMDDQTHIWFVGCNIGLNPNLMKEMRKLFYDKPTIYAFNKKHNIQYFWSGSESNCTKCSETVIKRGQKKGTGLWTKAGLQSIVHEP